MIDFLKKISLNEFDGNLSVPDITISKRVTDIYVDYNPAVDRLDIIAYKYYNDPKMMDIIYYANPDIFNEYELSINQTYKLRIPFPLEDVIGEILIQIERRINSE